MKVCVVVTTFKGKALLLSLTALVCLGVSVASYSRLTYPAAAMVAGLAVVLLVCFYCARRPMVRALWVNLAVLCAVLAAAECITVLSMPKGDGVDHRVHLEGGGGFFIGHDVLGYGPPKGGFASVLGHDNRRVHYTIGDDGLRATPQPVATDGRCVLFFGGSLTFGEGVNDDESFPYLVGQAAGVSAYNFGFPGYGPHQMLSALEHGLVDKTVRCQPSDVVYLAIPAHIPRVLGRVSWGPHPTYRLAADGRVRYDGQSNGWRVRFFLKKSALYKKLFLDRISHHYSDSDMDTYVGVVAASARLAANYPGVRFHTLLWAPQGVPGYQQTNAGLSRLGLPIYRADEIIPGFTDNVAAYQLLPGVDLHPNPEAHRRIASHLLGLWSNNP
jgi:hypothetical protein